MRYANTYFSVQEETAGKSNRNYTINGSNQKHTLRRNNLAKRVSHRVDLRNPCVCNREMRFGIVTKIMVLLYLISKELTM